MAEVYLNMAAVATAIVLAIPGICRVNKTESVGLPNISADTFIYPQIYKIVDTINA